MSDDDKKIDWRKFRESQRQDFSKKKKTTGGDTRKRSSRYSPTPKTFEKKRPPAWKMRHRDNKFMATETPSRIRILPTTQKEPWYKYRSKWVTTPKGKRQIISNSWNGERDVPCVLDYYCQKEENEAYWANEQSEKFAISVLVLEDFYKISNTSKNGFEYFTYERVPAPDRHGRISHKPGYEEHDVVNGRLLWWDLWDSQRKALLDKLKAVSDQCAGCGKGEISTYAYACVDCGNEFANHREESIDAEAEEQLRTMKVECEECEKYAKAKQLIECVHAEGVGSRKQYVEGCGSPTQSDWASCDVIVKSVTVGNRVAFEIVGFETSDEERDFPDWMTSPMDFDYFLGRQDLQEQADSMCKDNPFPEGAQGDLEKFFESPRDEEDNDSSPVDDDDVDDDDVDDDDDDGENPF